jgi:hypothetical protein
MNNTSMTLDQAKSKVLDMDNKTLEKFVNQRIENAFSPLVVPPY